MAVKKKKEAAMQGAPLWMVTYGDLVTLLLTFFVLLLSMSEIKQDQRVAEFMKAIRESFGWHGGAKPTVIKEIVTPKNENKQEFVLQTRPKSRAEPEILTWWSTMTTVPCVAIGGITVENGRSLIEAGADFLAVIAGVWDHPDGPAAAVKAFNAMMDAAAD